MNIVFYIGEYFPEGKLINKHKKDSLFIFTVQKPQKISNTNIEWLNIRSLINYLSIYYPDKVIIQKGLEIYSDLITNYSVEWI